MTIFTYSFSRKESTVPLMEYLQRAERALARDFINLENDELNWWTWADEMDATRIINGNDEPIYAGQACRRYLHCILAPDPTDKVQLSDLRRFCLEWAHLNFKNQHEVAIIYHNDNKNQVLHAHIVINNTNLETGKRLRLGKQDYDDMCLSVQQLAHKYGWKNFLDKRAEMTRTRMMDKDNNFSDPNIQENLEQYAHTTDRSYYKFISYKQDHYTKAELELLEQGKYSWKDDIRCRVRVALRLSDNKHDFLETLEALGVCTCITQTGDYQYSLQGLSNTKQKVNGYKLGYLYSQRGITNHYKTHENTSALSDREKRAYHEFLCNFNVRDTEYFSFKEPKYGITLKDVASTMMFNEEHNIECFSDYQKLISEAPTELEKLKAKQAKRISGIITQGRATPRANTALTIPEIIKLNHENKLAAIKQARRTFEEAKSENKNIRAKTALDKKSQHLKQEQEQARLKQQQTQIKQTKKDKDR